MASNTLEKIVEFFKKNNRAATTRELADYTGVETNVITHTLNRAKIPSSRCGNDRYWGRQKHVDVIAEKQNKIKKGLREILNG